MSSDLGSPVESLRIITASSGMAPVPWAARRKTINNEVRTYMITTQGFAFLMVPTSWDRLLLAVANLLDAGKNHLS